MMFTPNIIAALALAFLGGMVFALIIIRVADIRRQHRIDRIALPQYDLNNPINGGQPLPEDVIMTEEGIPLYRVRPLRQEV